jgi:4'-phosphopantetheinyl transferase
MVYILAANVKNSQDKNAYYTYLNALPVAMQKQLGRYKYLQDAQRSLYGKLLLLEGLKQTGNYHLTLDQLLLSRYNKPYFNSGFQFNISHSGNYAVCVVSECCRVGIDIEMVKKINLSEYRKCWTVAEWQAIIQSDCPEKTFYYFWTKKEAVIKALGKGLAIPLHEFEVLRQQAVVEGETWFFQELHIADEYMAHLATDRPLNRELVVRYCCF